MTELFEPSKALFNDCLRDIFVLELSESERLSLQLIAVDSLLPATPRPANAPVRESFSLVFCAPADGRLGQRTYRIQHPRLGGLDVFLVPIGPDPDGRGLRMEAVFNFVA
jgi:hypothetical protein